MAGFTYDNQGGGNYACLIKTDPSGNIEWVGTYKGGAAYCIYQCVDGGYVLGGTCRPKYPGSYGFWLIKTDSSGNMQWNKTYGGGVGDNYAYSLVQAGDGGYALVGYTTDNAGKTYPYFVKTDSSGNMQSNKTYGTGYISRAISVIQTSDGGYGIAGYITQLLSKCCLIKTDALGNMQWNQTYGLKDDYSHAYAVAETGDGGYILAGDVSSNFYLVKTDSTGNMQWNKTYGGTKPEECFSLAKTNDGGYVLAGEVSHGSSNKSFYLVKTDSTGNMQQNRTYSILADEHGGYSIVRTSDGGYAFTGQYYNASGQRIQMLLFKTDSSLNREWNKVYEGRTFDYTYAMTQASDGGYALAGWTNSYGSGGNDFFLVKASLNGWASFKNTYGGINDEAAYSIVQTGDGGYALVGYTNSFGAGGYDFWLVKTNSAGTLLWNKTYGGEGDEFAWSIVQTSDGGYAMGGCTTPLGAGQSDYWLVKTDSNGNVQWNKTYGGTFEEVAHSIVQTNDGGYALAGHISYWWPLNCSFWFVKTDSNGNMQWNKTYGEIDDGETAYSVIQTRDRGYALAGNTLHSGSDCDFWFVKTDSNGNMQWNKTYGGTEDDYCYSLAQTLDDGYVLAGASNSFGATAIRSYIVKTDSTGNEQWSKTYIEGSTGDTAKSVIQTIDGEYVFAGYSEEQNPYSSDCLLTKVSGEKNREHQKNLGYYDNGLSLAALTNRTITLWRSPSEPYWNYVRVRIWLIKEPAWIYGDINMDGVVDVKDLYIVSRNYGKTFSLLSISGIIAIAGIRTVKKRKQNKHPSNIS
jgi:hypothetical protein